jgi:putative transposase
MDPNSDRKRRSIRLAGFDYTQSGAYFITICAHRRRKIFCRIEFGEITLSTLGKLIAKYWQRLPIQNESVLIDEYVIMPNHMHGIVVIDIPRRGTIYRAPTRIERFGSPVRYSIPTIIRTFKAAVTRQWRSTTQNPSFIVWQRNYYERVIRDEFEMNKLRSYIHENPLRWELDQYYTSS